MAICLLEPYGEYQQSNNWQKGRSLVFLILGQEFPNTLRWFTQWYFQLVLEFVFPKTDQTCKIRGIIQRVNAGGEAHCCNRLTFLQKWLQPRESNWASVLRGRGVMYLTAPFLFGCLFCMFSFMELSPAKGHLISRELLTDVCDDTPNMPLSVLSHPYNSYLCKHSACPVRFPFLFFYTIQSLLLYLFANSVASTCATLSLDLHPFLQC